MLQTISDIAFTVSCLFWSAGAFRWLKNQGAFTAFERAFAIRKRKGKGRKEIKKGGLLRLFLLGAASFFLSSVALLISAV